jgi:hypothetical protein
METWMVARLGILAVIALAFVAVQTQRSPAGEDDGWAVKKHAERDGLVVWAWLGAGAEGPVVEVAIENRRERPVDLEGDRGGRRPAHRDPDVGADGRGSGLPRARAA